MELEEEHSRRMHLEKELEGVRHLEAMRHGLHNMRQAVCQHKHILEQTQEGNDDDELGQSKDAGAVVSSLDDTAFQG